MLLMMMLLLLYPVLLLLVVLLLVLVLLLLLETILLHFSLNIDRNIAHVRGCVSVVRFSPVHVSSRKVVRMSASE